jgi:hypothetical protein
MPETSNEDGNVRTLLTEEIARNTVIFGNTRMRRFSCITLLFFLTSCGSGGLSPDSVIEDLFYKHQMEFEQLKAMASQDSFISLSEQSFVSKAGYFVFRDREPTENELGGIAKERWSKYLTLMKSAGIGQILKGKGDSVTFKINRESLVNGDRSKGITYSVVPLAPLKPSLDGFRPSPNMVDSHGGFVVYRELKPHWYLYLAS